jgi:uncharacterized protein YjbJ (UPF0337 family)
MNKETLEGNWNALKGKAKEKWGKLTDDDLTRIAGKKDQLIGELQKKYGYMKEKAEDEIAKWQKSCGSCGCAHEHDSSGSHDSDAHAHAGQAHDTHLHNPGKKNKH